MSVRCRDMFHFLVVLFCTIKVLKKYIFNRVVFCRSIFSKYLVETCYHHQENENVMKILYLNITKKSTKSSITFQLICPKGEPWDAERLQRTRPSPSKI